MEENFKNRLYQKILRHKIRREKWILDRLSFRTEFHELVLKRLEEKMARTVDTPEPK